MKKELSLSVSTFRTMANSAYREFLAEKYAGVELDVLGHVSGLLARTQSWMNFNQSVKNTLSCALIYGIGGAVQQVIMQQLNFIDDKFLCDGLIEGTIDLTEYGYVVSLNATVTYQLAAGHRISIAVDFEIPVYEWQNDMFVAQAIRNIELQAELQIKDVSQLVTMTLEQQSPGMTPLDRTQRQVFAQARLF